MEGNQATIQAKLLGPNDSDDVREIFITCNHEDTDKLTVSGEFGVLLMDAAMLRALIGC
jgi:hypothetical protein